MHQANTNYIESREEHIKEEILSLEEQAERGEISYEKAQTKIISLWDKKEKLNVGVFA